MGTLTSASLLILVFCIYSVFALPSSMLDEIKARELKPNKVKRVSVPARNPDESYKADNHNYDNPTAIKRGTTMQDTADTDATSNNGDWTAEDNAYQNADNDFQSTLYNDENGQEWKNVNDYEKSYQYGINREKLLDEALENAVLKSELYGTGPASLNQYRYLENEKRKRRKRDYNYGYHGSSNDLTPDEVQALLNLYETEQDLNDLEQDSDTWLEVPVRPHVRYSDFSKRRPSTTLDQSKQTSFRQNNWAANRNHFMAARKRNDPTRELRYLNGPVKNDYYSLSQLLSNHREPNVPVYHRYIL